MPITSLLKCHCKPFGDAQDKLREAIAEKGSVTHHPEIAYSNGQP
ncbi:MAG: hypothetical protein PHY28_08290 [Dehalococcoidales bacterium]|nr:hypothetical protein [Dehalococcoidales bacterium]